MSDLLMGEWYDKDTLPPPSEENKLQSVKVITDEGDAAYYSYGYKRWEWWVAVDFEQEPQYPVFKQWTPFTKPSAHITTSKRANLFCPIYAPC